MEHQIPLSPGARADSSATNGDGTHQILHDLAFQNHVFVNVAFVGVPYTGDRRWVLVDAAIIGSAGSIAKAAAARFGKKARPAAILMTHGHFDHVGALKELAEQWDAPIYAHPLELPYLDGRASYPPADPSVGGGLMARLSSLYPTGPVDVSRWLQPLPDDGSVPGLPGWRWLHTPGHTPGHVSFWREEDGTLIAGDAFVTTKSESAYEANFAQEPEMHGPPQYFTPDWVSAKRSVETLAALEPRVALTGHGHPVRDREMREALHQLAREFDQIAVPAQGRYVGEPAQADESGPTHIPPKA